MINDVFRGPAGGPIAVPGSGKTFSLGSQERDEVGKSLLDPLGDQVLHDRFH